LFFIWSSSSLQLKGKDPLIGSNTSLSATLYQNYTIRLLHYKNPRHNLDGNIIQSCK